MDGVYRGRHAVVANNPHLLLLLFLLQHLLMLHLLVVAASTECAFLHLNLDSVATLLHSSDELHFKIPVVWRQI